MKPTIYSLIALLWLATACNLEQAVDLDLPAYTSKPVVECYLQPGQPHLLMITRSVGYFDNIQLAYEREATVRIIHAGDTLILQPFEIRLDDPATGGLLDTALLNTLRPIVGDALYLYLSPLPVPADYESQFALEITLATGETIRSQTTIPKPVTIESVEWKFNADSMAYVLTRFQDDGNQANYYRRLLQARVPVTDSVTGDTLDWATRTEQDFTTDDQINNGSTFLFGTAYDYRAGDTLISTVYSLTGEYFRFIETRDAAIVANLSPFGQPAVVYGNIEGGTGIFTGISTTSKQVVITR
ncbi:MAG: DUF4249 domain-containing protein [Bacteroidia bacterium]|nr:DUF4249 domain-containing protein [Bacteroidia bacterium]